MIYQQRRECILFSCVFLKTTLYAIQTGKMDPFEKLHIQQELRFVELVDCLPTARERFEDKVYGRRPMLHCPSGARLHIEGAQLEKPRNPSLPCLLSEDDGTLTSPNKHPISITERTDPQNKLECSPLSVKSSVQKLCNGMSTCDIVPKLTEVQDLSTCPSRRTLRVNYTCLPVYSQIELICADSYVEIGCAALGTDFKLLILEAKSLHNMSTEVDHSKLMQENKCTSTTPSVQCAKQDVTWFYSSLCTRRPVCTINPNMVIKELTVQAYTEDTFGTTGAQNVQTSSIASNNEQIPCSKSNLYLHYTCAHAVLLKPEEKLVSKSIRPKNERNSKAQDSYYSPDFSDQVVMHHTWNSENKKVKQGVEFAPKIIHLEETRHTTGSENKITTTEPGKTLGQAVENSASDMDSSYILLVSLIPSIVCLLVVIILMGYVSHQKRLNHLKRIPHQQVNEYTPCHQKVSRMGSTVESCQVVMETNTTKQMYPGSSKEQEKHFQSTNPTMGFQPYWNQVALGAKNVSEECVPSSSCHSCSEPASSPTVENVHRIYNVLPQSSSAHLPISSGPSPNSTSTYLKRTDLRFTTNEVQQNSKATVANLNVPHSYLSKSESDTVISAPHQSINCRMHFSHQAATPNLPLFNQSRFESCSICDHRETVNNSHARSNGHNKICSAAPVILNPQPGKVMNKGSTKYPGSSAPISNSGNGAMQIRPQTLTSNITMDLKTHEPSMKLFQPLFSPGFRCSSQATQPAKLNLPNNTSVRRIPVVKYPHETDESTDEDGISIAENQKDYSVSLLKQQSHTALKNNRPDLCPSQTDSEDLLQKCRKGVATSKQLNDNHYNATYMTATNLVAANKFPSNCPPTTSAMNSVTPILSFRAVQDSIGSKPIQLHNPRVVTDCNMDLHNPCTTMISEMTSSFFLPATSQGC